MKRYMFICILICSFAFTLSSAFANPQQDETVNLKVWEIKHSAGVISAEFSYDNKMVITGDRDGNVKLFKIENNQFVLVDGYSGQHKASTARFSPNNKMVLIINQLGSAKLFKIVDNKLLYLNEISSSSWGFQSALFSSDSKILITTDNQNNTKFHKIINDQIIPSFQLKDRVLDAKISHDNKIIITAEESKAKLYTVENEQLILQDVVNDSNWGMHKVLFSPNERMVIIGTTFTGEYSQSRLYKIENNKLIRTDAARAGEKINSREFSGNNEMYIEAIGDGRVRLYKVINNRLMSLDTIHTGHSPFDVSPYSARFSTDNKMVLIACYDGAAKVYKIENSKLVYLAEIKHSSEVLSAKFSTDNKMIITASEDGTVRITSVRELEIVKN